MPTLILLNGTSSAGKSSILHELTALRPDFIIYKADTWFPPEKIKKAEQLDWKQRAQSIRGNILKNSDYFCIYSIALSTKDLHD